MKRRIVYWTAALVAWPLAAQPDPLTSMNQVGQQILSCWTPPPGVRHSMVRMSFSFNRDGSLIGPPQPTFIDIAGDEDTRQTFIAAATDAVDNCTPLEFAPDLAAGIGGQVFTLEFATGDRQQSITPDN